MKKRIVYELKENCALCDKDEWVVFPFDMRMLMYTQDCAVHFQNHKNKEHFIGVTRNEYKICFRCMHLLIGFEDHYDKSWQSMMDTEDFSEIKRMIKMIHADDELFKECFKHRAKGDMFPKELIDKLKKEEK